MVNCGICKFYAPPTGGPAGSSGECRFYPPVPVRVLNGSAYEVHSIRPPVMPRDACGQGQPGLADPLATTAVWRADAEPVPSGNDNPHSPLGPKKTADE